MPNLAAAKAEAAAAASEWMKDYVSAAGAELKLSVRDGKPGPVFVVAASIKVYSPADEYRARAEECRRKADQSSDGNDKAIWLHLTQHWLQMAQQASEPATNSKEGSDLGLRPATSSPSRPPDEGPQA